ncbi:hypothetical protein HMI54_008526 [Coelomomyces lativittatus]|nr:hypothetical protein HMI55_003926 [Coelomomyces lativittatus]KAJ1516689.1 hypothetical protein HMI54_008526 [Coelomomyces lativittatus]
MTMNGASIFKHPKKALKVNLIRARSLATLPSFPVLHERLPLSSLRCQCTLSGKEVQHETLIVPHLVGENFGIQIINSSYKPSHLQCCLVGLVYFKDQLCHSLFLPQGSSQVIHTLQKGNAETHGRVCTLRFQDTCHEEKALLAELYSTLNLETNLNTEFSPAQKWIPTFRIELWQVDKDLVPNFSSIQTQHTFSSSSSSTASFLGHNTFHAWLPSHSTSSALLAIVHLHLMCFSTLCQLATSLTLFNPYHPEVDLLFTLIKETQSISFPLSLFLQRRCSFPRNLVQHLHTKKLWSILERPPQTSRPRSGPTPTKPLFPLKKKAKGVPKLSSSHCRPLPPLSSFLPTLFSSPPPTPPTCPSSWTTSLHPPSSSTSSFPRPLPSTYTPTSTSIPTPTPTPTPLLKQKSAMSMDRGSIQFLIQEHTPSTSPCTSPGFIPSYPSRPSFSKSTSLSLSGSSNHKEKMDTDKETLKRIAHTLTLLHSQCT